MATLDLWRLPSGTGAAFLSRETGGVVAFSDGADAIMTLELAATTLRRWAIPAALHGSPTGSAAAGAIVSDGAKSSWCALTAGQRLLRLDTAGRTMTSYRDAGPGPFDPLGYPLRVRLDANGLVWFAGYATRSGGGLGGPVVGRLAAGANAATSWVLSALPAMRVTDLWIQEVPQRIWFTLQLWHSHAAPGGPIPVLGCLDPATSDVTLWRRAPQLPYGVQHFFFGCTALAGNSPTSPKLVWATFQTSYGPSSVLALEIAAGTVREFAPPTPGFLNALDLDLGARPWVAALGGDRITQITGLRCGVAVALTQQVQAIAPLASEVLHSEAPVQPRRLACSHRRSSIRPRKSTCFLEFGLGGIVPYDAVAATAGAVEVLVTAPTVPAIGRLAP